MMIKPGKVHIFKLWGQWVYEYKGETSSYRIKRAAEFVQYKNNQRTFPPPKLDLRYNARRHG